jgi:putative phage-type endonuclease
MMELDHVEDTPTERALVPWQVVCDSREDAEWKRARRATIGASESAVVLGCSPWSSAYALWAEKTGRSGGPQLDGAEFIFWGHALENAIIDGYAKRAQRWTLPFGLLLRSRRWPWMSATPDALVTNDPEHGARAPLISRTLGHIRAALKKGADTERLHVELAHRMRGWWPLQIKNIGFGSAEHWAHGVPDYYRVQCVHEALVFGAPQTTAAALIAGQRLAWDDVEAREDELLARRIVNLTRRFMREHVEAGREPELDGTEATRRALRDVYPQSTDRTVQAGGELDALGAEYDRVKAQQLEATSALKTVENRVKRTMEDAERMTFSDGSGFTFKTNAAGARVLLRKKAKED